MVHTLVPSRLNIYPAYFVLCLFGCFFFPPDIPNPTVVQFQDISPLFYGLKASCGGFVGATT